MVHSSEEILEKAKEYLRILYLYRDNLGDDAEDESLKLDYYADYWCEHFAKELLRISEERK